MDANKELERVAQLVAKLRASRDLDDVGESIDALCDWLTEREKTLPEVRCANCGWGGKISELVPKMSADICPRCNFVVIGR